MNGFCNKNDQPLISLTIIMTKLKIKRWFCLYLFVKFDLQGLSSPIDFILLNYHLSQKSHRSIETTWRTRLFKFNIYKRPNLLLFVSIVSQSGSWALSSPIDFRLLNYHLSQKSHRFVETTWRTRLFKFNIYKRPNLKSLFLRVILIDSRDFCDRW